MNTRKDDRTFKQFIVEGLLILLKKKAFADITIKEITEKAGVNRSTYYRNFNMKEDIVICFYTDLLTTCSSETRTETNEDHLRTIFHTFYMQKEVLLCLHKQQCSYLLFGVLNTFFSTYGRMSQVSDFHQAFDIYYHAGGVFHTLLLWFDQGMAQAPNELVKYSLQLLPNDFKPFLMKVS